MNSFQYLCPHCHEPVPWPHEKATEIICPVCKMTSKVKALIMAWEGGQRTPNTAEGPDPPQR